ncbi:MAG: T9SS type A sorting domain-containing protein [Saprospiraceae bacterium]
MRFFIILTLNLFFIFPLSAQTYKDMINDMSINFYEVCDSAESYFSRIDINAKGSGWKNYARWKNNNEYKYYPTGRRDNVDPYFQVNAYDNFLQNNAGLNITSSTWVELGPSEVTNITGQYSAGLGRVEDLYVDPTNANVIYLGSRSGGFWKTVDGGANWTGGTTDNLVASGVNTMGVAPMNKDSILINVQNAENDISHGLYRSVNAGDTWTQTAFNPTNLGMGGLGSYFRVYTVRYHPTISDLIFVGTTEGLYRSTDNLQTWSNLIPSSNVTNMAFHPTDPNIVYLISSMSGERDYVWYSTDKGVTWIASAQIASNNDNRGLISTTPDCPDCVYFCSDNGVWKSTNKGLTFSNINSSSASNDGFAVNDLDQTNMMWGNIDMWTSTDEGASFDQTGYWYLANSNNGSGTLQQNFNNSTAYVHADLRVAKCINGVFYLGTDGFLCKSTDNGLTWEYISQGTAIRENYKLGVSQSNSNRTILGSQDNGTSIYTESGWVEFYGADGMEAIIHPLNDDWMMSSVQYGGRRITKDGGQSGLNKSPTNQSGSGNAAWEAPLAYSPSDQMQVYHFSLGGVYTSNDFGTSWAFKGSPSFSGTISQAAIAENNSDIVIVSRGQDIEKSTDGGATFSDIQNTLPSASIQDIAFDPQDDNTMIVTYARYQNDGNKVFITTDGGSTWTNITYNLGDMPIHTVVIDHSANKNIYLGAELGVYTKTMGATTWSLYNTNLPNVTVEELEIIYGSNTLRAGSWGRGLWEISLLNRSTYPSITNTSITDQPTDTSPPAGSNQYVTSTIDYSGTLSNVYLEWSQNSNALGNQISMTNTSGNTWVSDSPIPNYAGGTKIYFKVFAEGASSDDSETYRFMYTVQAGSLPIELTKFTALPIDNRVVELNWQTASEINNDYFSIQRSMDGNNWEEIEKVDGLGDSNVNQYYSMTDKEPYTGISYYRLKQIDLDGKYAYSPIQVVTIKMDAIVRVFPNPSKGQITIEGEKNEIQTLAIYDETGKEVSSSIGIIDKTDRSCSIDISQLTPGIYFVKTKTQTVKVLKN